MKKNTRKRKDQYVKGEMRHKAIRTLRKLRKLLENTKKTRRDQGRGRMERKTWEK